MRCLNCNSKFEVKRFLQKHCDNCKGAEQIYQNQKRSEAQLKAKPKTPLKITALKPSTKPIAKMSGKKKVATGIYLKKRVLFLEKPENKKCAVYPDLDATEIHHKAGRVGELYLDETKWLAVSRSGHQKIELNPQWAKEMGFSLSRLEK